MFTGKSPQKIKASILLLSVFVFTQCSRQVPPASQLPKDISGINIGMSKEAATRRLREIAEFARDEEKRQEVWQMKNDARFSHIAVGYDENNQIRYVTALVDKATAKERIRFTEVGDLSKAKEEIVEPHRRYIWEVPASENTPAYSIIINGDEQEFVSIYSLSKVGASQEEDKE